MPAHYIVSTAPRLLRNNGVGDYYESADGSWNILASEMKNPRHTDLILTHEFIEVLLIRAAGIPEPVIDAWDAYFEVLRKYGLVDKDAEPGDDPRAPYYKQHQMATKIEKLMCEEGFEIDWDDYGDAVDEFE